MLTPNVGRLLGILPNGTQDVMVYVRNCGMSSSKTAIDPAQPMSPQSHPELKCAHLLVRQPTWPK